MKYLYITFIVSILSGCVTTRSAKEHGEYRYQEGREQELRFCNERYEKLYKSFQELKDTFDKFFVLPKNQEYIIPLYSIE